MNIIRIALAGLSRTGKDTVAAMLQTKLALKKVCYGDLIKQDLFDPISEHFGFSPFTENDDEKDMIRPICEAWGNSCPDLEYRFYDNLPYLAVNPRIFRPAECAKWKEHGGVIWEVVRPGVYPKTVAEMEQLKECRKQGYIDGLILNDSTLEALAHNTFKLLKERFNI